MRAGSGLVAPAPIAIDMAELPVIVMGCVEGIPLYGRALTPEQLESLAATLDAIFHLTSSTLRAQLRPRMTPAADMAVQVRAFFDGETLPEDLSGYRSAYLGNLGGAYALAGEPERCVALQMDALKVAQGVGLEEGVARVRAVRRRHLEPYAELSAVRQLDEQLRATA
jgi:hypothetical protein